MPLKAEAQEVLGSVGTLLEVSSEQMMHLDPAAGAPVRYHCIAESSGTNRNLRTKTVFQSRPTNNLCRSSVRFAETISMLLAQRRTVLFQY